MLRYKKTTGGKPPDTAPFPLRPLALALVSVFLISLVLVLIVHIPAVQEVLLKKVVKELQTRTDLEIQLASFHWSPFRELRLVNLKVATAGENFIECDEARLGYHFSWKWPYLYAEEIVLEKPWLRLERDAQGHWQLPAAKARGSAASPSGKPFPWASFPWPRVHLVSGNIVATQDGQTVLSIRDVNATLSFQEVAGSDGPRLKIDFGQWQGCVDTPELGEWQLTGEAEIREHTLFVTQIELSLPKVAQVSARGRWDLAPPFDGAAEIHIMELATTVLPALRERLPQLTEVTGFLRLSRQSGNWLLDHDLKSNLGNLQGILEMEPDAAHGRIIQFISRFADLRIPVLSQTSESHLFGQVEFTLQGSELRTAQAKVHTLLESSRWGDQTLRHGELTGTYDRGMIAIKTSKLQSSLGDFDLSASADLGGLWDQHHQGEVKFDLRAEQASLEKVFSGAAQRLGGSIDYAGHYGAGDFTRWERWQGKMEANLSLPQLLTLKASGIQKNDSMSLDYELEASDLQKLSAFFPGWSGKGRVTSRGTIKGRWPDLVWDGVISSPLFQYGGLQGEQASLKGKGKIIGKEAQRELTLKVQNFNADGKKMGSLSLDLQQEADACRFNLKSDGLLSHGNARISGRVEKLWGPLRTLVVSQSTLAWKNQSASLDGKIEAGNDGIRVHALNVQHGKGKAQLAGEVRFDARTDLKLTFDGINLAPLSQAITPEYEIAGTASGQLSLNGATDRPEASFNVQVIRPTFTVPRKTDEGHGASPPNKTSLQGPSFERLQLQGTLLRDVLSVQGDVQGPSVQNPVHLSAKIPIHLRLNPPALNITTTDEWAFTAKVAGLQAESVLPYLSFLEKLGGRIDLDVQGAGTIGQPLIAGAGSWQNGSLKIKNLPYPIENIQVAWQADSRQITIQKGEMDALGGHLEVKGNAGYPRFQEMYFEAQGADLEVKDIFGIKGKVTGRAELTQTATSSKLTGTLDLAKGEMDLGQLESDLARNIRVVDGEGKGEVIEVKKNEIAQNSFWERLEMDLLINLPPSGTWVRGKGLDAEITGALKLAKRPFAPLKLRGGFQTLRGEYKIHDYKLKIVDGELIFPESPQPDPQLKIICQKDVKDAIIQVHVTGPLSQPKLVMSSIPSMNQVDILSYLLFDRPAGDLSSKESFQLQDKAASWLGSQTSTLLKRVLGDTLLTPDTIEYRKSTITNRATGSSNTRADVSVVAIGKYLTPDLYVNFEKGVTGEEGNQIDVEYRLNRHLSIQTQFGGTQQSGIDVFWRYDFGK